MENTTTTATDFYQLPPEEQGERMKTLARKALQHYNINPDAKLKLLGYRENAVFSVSTKDRKYALRIHRYGYHSDDALRSELQWMESLDAFGVKTPPVIRGKNGDTVYTVSVEDIPYPHQVDMLAWVMGSPPQPENIVQSFNTLGKLNAKLHQHAETWERPEGFTRHSWDLDGMMGANPLWGRYADLEQLTEEQIQVLHQARDIARKKLAAYGTTKDRYGLIHADMMPENIMVTAEEINVIDFDDGGFGWFMYDFATSLFFNQPEPFYSDIYNAWLEGYQTVRPLSEEDISMVPTFLVCRGLVGLGWLHTRKETAFAQEITEGVIGLAMHVAQGYVDSEGKEVGAF